MFDLKAKDIRKFLQGIMGSKIKWFTPPSFLHARCQFVCPHVQYIGNLTPTLDHRKIFIVFLHEYTGNDFFFALSFRLYSEKMLLFLSQKMISIQFTQFPPTHQEGFSLPMSELKRRQASCDPLLLLKYQTRDFLCSKTFIDQET